MGVLGFCWGIIGVLLASQDPQFKFGITLHPSFGLIPHLGIDPIRFSSMVIAP